MRRTPGFTQVPSAGPTSDRTSEAGPPASHFVDLQGSSSVQLWLLTMASQQSFQAVMYMPATWGILSKCDSDLGCLEESHAFHLYSNFPDDGKFTDHILNSQGLEKSMHCHVMTWMHSEKCPVR